jgi:hypothetical protein
LGEKRCRDLHEIDTAFGKARGEPAQVADDAAAESDDEVFARHAGLQEMARDHFEAGEALGAFAGRQRDGPVLEAGGVER